MPRTVEFGPDRLTVHLTGLVHYASLTTDLPIPYSAITAVTTEPFVPPEGTLRWFGVHVPFSGIREGRFSHGGEWYFISVEDPRRAVTLRLAGYSHGDAPEPLAVVVIGAADPERLRAEIESHRASSPGARAADGGPPATGTGT